MCPVLPETEGMIGADQLALLRDGAVFLNAAARWSSTNGPAARTADGPLRRGARCLRQRNRCRSTITTAIYHVLLTPHAAGHTVDTHQRQGAAMVEEIARFLAGEPLQYEVTAAMLPTMA